MNTISIKEVKSLVACGNDGKAAHVFNLRNRGDRRVRVGVQIAVDAPAESKWLEMEGAGERLLEPGAMSQFVVRIQAPADCPPGKYSYRLRAYDPDDPGERYMEGETVYFEVVGGVEEETPAAVQKKRPWIPYAIAAGIVALISVAVIRYSNEEMVDIPIVEGMLLEEAQASLRESGLTGTVRAIRNCGYPPDLVLRQEPRSGSVSRDADVLLSVVKKRERIPAPTIGGSGKLRTLSPGQSYAANAWALKGTGIMFGLEGDDCTEGIVTVTHPLGKGTWSYPMKSGQRKDVSEFYGAGKLTVLFSSNNPAARLKLKIW